MFQHHWLADWLTDSRPAGKSEEIVLRIQSNEMKRTKTSKLKDTEKQQNETDALTHVHQERKKKSYAMDHHGSDHSLTAILSVILSIVVFVSFCLVYSSVVVVAYAHSVVVTYIRFLRHNLAKCKLVSIAKILFRKQQII